MERSDFIGTYDEDRLDALIDYIRREISTIDWAQWARADGPDSLGNMAQDIVQHGMEIAFHCGLDAMEAVEGGISSLARPI